MTFTVHDCAQRTPEWAALRLGRLTSSEASAMLAMTEPEEFTPTGRKSRAKPKEKAGRKNLRVRLILERLTGRCHERIFQSQAMLDGIERESDALELYEMTTGKLARAIGFISHADAQAGFSPDGIIGDFVGAVEAKCPIPATHLDFLRSGKVPHEYMAQMTHGFWCCPCLEWCDYVSFHPDFPEALQLKILRVARADVDLAAYDAKARAFLREVDDELAALRTMADVRATLTAAVA